MNYPSSAIDPHKLTVGNDFGVAECNVTGNRLFKRIPGWPEK